MAAATSSMQGWRREAKRRLSLCITLLTLSSVLISPQLPELTDQTLIALKLLNGTTLNTEIQLVQPFPSCRVLLYTETGDWLREKGHIHRARDSPGGLLSPTGTLQHPAGPVVVKSPDRYYSAHGIEDTNWRLQVTYHRPIWGGKGTHLQF